MKRCLIFLFALLMFMAIPGISLAQDGDDGVTLRKRPGGNNKPDSGSKDDGKVHLGPGRPSYLGKDGHPKDMPWVPPTSQFYTGNRNNRDRWDKDRWDKDRWDKDRWGKDNWDHDRWDKDHGYYNSNGNRYYSRHDRRTWPQASVNFSWGLYGNYSRYRNDPSHGFSDSRFGALFTYLDSNLAIKFGGVVNPSKKQVEYETLVLINNYVDENVETIAVNNDGSYYVQFRSDQNGEAQWVPTDVTSEGVEEAARESSQY
ncbi:MAG: hypothetical protein LBE27_06500 [Deltaproteobacteria bacterium]|jgi:hypothetical protein|nr:hypothetical protein [Deltaproteobacteria bacterium]